jgi:transcriptional antiterminator RfaH
MADASIGHAGEASARGASWYLVHSQPNSELKAMEHLQRQGFVAYLPQYERTRRHARRVETVRAPFFPRYLFVELDVTAQQWRSINSTVGVSRLVGTGQAPQPVMPGVVENIRARENDEGLLVLAAQATRFRAGDAIRVTEGAFEACQGLFLAATDHERVAILLDLLGRKVRVMLDAGAVAAA